jgi:hypothetical protein
LFVGRHVRASYLQLPVIAAKARWLQPGALMRRLATVFILLLSACSEESGNETCEGKCDDLGDGEDSSEMVRCWVEKDPDTTDPFFAVDNLHCSLHQGPARLFAASVQIKTAKGKVSSVRFDGSETEVAKAIPINRDGFPVDVVVSLSIATDDPLKDLGVHELSIGFDVATPDALPMDDPELISFPLRQAPMSFYAATTADLRVEYDLDVSPFVIGSLLSVPPSDRHTLSIAPVRTNMRFGERSSETLWVGQAQGSVPVTGPTSICRARPSSRTPESGRRPGPIASAKVSRSPAAGSPKDRCAAARPAPRSPSRPRSATRPCRWAPTRWRSPPCRPARSGRQSPSPASSPGP